MGFQRTLVFCAVLILVAPSCRKEVPVSLPRIVGSGLATRLDLPPAMQSALDEHNGFMTGDRHVMRMSEFAPAVLAALHEESPVGEAPFAVVLDLDGDAREDVALIERDFLGMKFVLIRSPSGVPVVEDLQTTIGSDRENGLTSLRLRRRRAGPFLAHDSIGKQYRLMLDHDGVIQEQNERDRSLYYWSGGAIHEISFEGTARP
jgi:hypothetical protein